MALLPASAVVVQAQSPLSLSGSAGVTAKGYSVNGIENRRAPAALDAFARLSFNLAGLTSGVNLSYSTDESGVRQSINKFAFRTSWDSGTLSIGDVSTNYSAYSMQGVTTRGGSIEQSIGSFFFAAGGGRSRRAINVSRLESFRGSSFSRYLFGSRFGVGTPDGSHLHLIAVYAKDKADSIDEPGELRPAANVSATPSMALTLFDGVVSVRAQVTGSVFTPDHTNTLTTNRSIPSFARPFVTEGSRLDYAGNAELAIQRPDYGVVTTFTRIQPGFSSLSLSQIRSDEQTIRIAPRARLLNGRVAISGSVARSENNLYSNLLSTLTRDQADGALQVQVSQGFSVAVAANLLRNVAAPVGSSAALDPQSALQQKQVGRTLMISPTWMFQAASGITHTATVSGSQQTFDDKSDAVLSGQREGFESTNTSVLVVYAVRLPSSISLTLTGNIVSSQASSSDADIRSASLSIGVRPLANLNTTLTAGWSGSTLTFVTASELVERTGTQYTAGLTASYTVTRSANVRFQVRGVANRSNQDFGDFDEVQSSLSFTQRF